MQHSQSLITAHKEGNSQVTSPTANKARFPPDKETSREGPVDKETSREGPVERVPVTASSTEVAKLGGRQQLCYTREQHV